MINELTRKNAHTELDHIFKTILPAHGMTERPEQIRLSHTMLDAMFEKRIALSDAGNRHWQDVCLPDRCHRVQPQQAGGRTSVSAGDYRNLQHRPPERHCAGVSAVPVGCAVGRSAYHNTYSCRLAQGQESLCL